MKILTNPDWVELLEPLPPDIFKEIVLCILTFPEREYDHPIWRFIRKELVRNSDNYNKQIERLNINRQKRWPSEQTSDKSKQMPKPSAAIDRKEKLDKNNIKNIDRKRDIDRLLTKMGRNFSVNAPKKYEINDDLELSNLFDSDPAIQQIFLKYDTDKIVKAIRNLKDKRFGEFFTAQQIEGWIAQEGKF